MILLKNHYKMNETDTALLISERFGLKQTLKLFLRQKQELGGHNLDNFSYDSSLKSQMDSLTSYF